MAMKIMPKTITGSLSSFNKGACDWGWQGFIAFGCQNNIVIVDSTSVQIVQVLDCQSTFITKVKWACENYHHNLAAPYILRLGASETSGRIQIWDVMAGRITAECTDTAINRVVSDMHWVPAQEVSRDLLLVLYGPNTLILWNAENGSKLWKRTYPDSLRMFVFDPFDKSKLAFLGNNGSQDFLVFADFNPSRVPAGNGRKFFISPTNIPKSTSTDKITEKRGVTKSAFRRMGAILVGESGRKSSEVDDLTDTDQCIEIQYHKACKYHLILVYSREVLVLDLDLNQTVSTITSERIGSQFCQVSSIRQRDAIFCLHENGTVSLRARHWSTQIPSTNQDAVSISSGMLDTCDICDPHYYTCCQSDMLRITKLTKIMGFSVCPVSEQKLALITNNGRVMIWQLTNSSSSFSSTTNLNKIFTISDLIPPSDEYLSDSCKTSLGFLLIGLLGGLAPPPFVVKMCPPLTTKNFNFYQPWLAVGCAMGSIQIWNLSSGQLHREYSMHSCGVHGIEWLSLGAILSFGYQTLANTSVSTLVRNEISITELDTGITSPIRNHMEEDESRIEAIRVSYLKQYFVITFKEHRPPLEIWDIKSRCLIRRMPRGFPLITAVEWSPTHSVKNLKKKKVPTATLR